MKTRRTNRRSTPHGGVIPILSKLREFGVPQVIRKCLGERKKQAKYSYADMCMAWILTSMCGGKKLEHISKMKKKLSVLKRIKLPSHDTLGRVMKQLAEEVKTDISITKKRIGKIVQTDYDDNIKMNRMLIQTSKRSKAIKEGPSYTMDIDATFINTLCRGAVRKMNRNGTVDHSKIGFNPMICLINGIIVFVSMRNGDANAKFKLTECLENCLNLMNESKIKIGRVVSDAAGYTKELLEMLNARGIKFNVKFPYSKKMETFKKKLKECRTWRKTEIKTANNVWDCEIADISYKMHDRPEEEDVSQELRVVAIRMPTDETLKVLNKDKWEANKLIKEKLKELSKRKILKESGKNYVDKHWKKIDGYQYKFYVTNDFETCSENIVKEYNKRGDAERKFSFMKNDFGWKYPPFMNMNENTVFFILAALANNVFRSMVKIFNKIIPGLRLNTTLPDFQFVFIHVSCYYNHNDGYYEFDNTDIPYEKLM